MRPCAPGKGRRGWEISFQIPFSALLSFFFLAITTEFSQVRPQNKQPAVISVLETLPASIHLERNEQPNLCVRGTHWYLGSIEEIRGSSGRGCLDPPKSLAPSESVGPRSGPPSLLQKSVPLAKTLHSHFSLLKNLFLLNYVYVCIALCCYVHMSEARGIRPLVLELQMVMSHSTWVLQSSKSLTDELSDLVSFNFLTQGEKEPIIQL